MKKYLIYYRLGFRDLLAYKADFVIYIVANMVFFFVAFALWKNIYGGNDPTIGSYTLNNTITYFFLTSFIFRLDPTFAMYLNETVWNGNFTNDLVKPWNALAVDLIYTLLEISLKILLYIPFGIFMFIAARSYIDLPSGANLIYFLITTFIGIFLAYSFYKIVHGLCFHFGDQEANINLISYIVSFFSWGIFSLIFSSWKFEYFFPYFAISFYFRRAY